MEALKNIFTLAGILLFVVVVSAEFWAPEVLKNFSKNKWVVAFAWICLVLCLLVYLI